MKKILLLSLLIAIAVASCRKYSNPSITVTASFPTITFTNNNIYYTIPVTGLLPKNIATAYDSFYKTSPSVVLIDSTVNAFVPGLYQATAIAENQYGYVTIDTYYVAVTDLPNANLVLTGKWKIGASDSFDNYITPLVTGYYNMTNINGDTGSGVIPAIFAVINDSTIEFTGDTYYGTGGTLSLVPGDTTMTTPYNITFTKYL